MRHGDGDGDGDGDDARTPQPSYTAIPAPAVVEPTLAPATSRLDRRQNPSQERHVRSRSRTRFSYASSSTAPRRSDRSSSRASFLGRPRHRTYEISAPDEPGAQAGASTARWRSESRTVRGSLEDNDDREGFVFTDEDESEPTPSKTTNLRKTYKKTSLSPPPNRQLASQATGTSIPASSKPSGSGTSPSPSPQEKPSAEDIEKQLEEEKPSTRFARLPYPIAHFLGYRTEKTENRALLRPVEKLPRKLETLIWAWIGAMIGLSIVMVTFSRWDKFSSSSNVPITRWTAPIIIGSFGASSVILYGTPASPLGQPKSFVMGQLISALVGCCILKLFQLNSNYNPQLIDDPHSLVWVAGGISVATALCTMILTDTVHPPGGATALLITTSPPVIRLGWNYIPVILLSSVLMLAWALLWINLGRGRYPTHWITAKNKAVSLAALGVTSDGAARLASLGVSSKRK